MPRPTLNLLATMWLVLCLLACLTACGPGDDDDDDGPADRPGDDDDDDAYLPPEEPAWIEERPYLLDRSVWSDEVRLADGTTIREDVLTEELHKLLE